ncbi:MAG TPA: hypothetical protein VE685_16885 [Thermoanaerobaculia bacterium]|nr:hypothetical protein [Thermoanaerobaculia bacterium]
MFDLRIRGVVKDAETGVGLPGLFLKAFDKKLRFDDLLGSAFSGPQGEFEIISELSDFRAFFDVKPDIHIKVFRGDRRTLLHTTEKAIRWKSGKIPDFDIRIPNGNGEPEVSLLDDDGRRREELEVGESLTLSARGLRPAHAYDIRLSSDGREFFTSRLLTNSKGELEPSVLWPQTGLDDPNSDARFTVDEARRRWRGRTLELVLASRGRKIFARNVRIAATFTRPLALCTDRDGRLLNGFEVGTQPLHLTVSNLPFGGLARIYLVPRQHDWRVGDRFEPTRLAGGRPAVLDVEVPERGRTATLELAPADAFLPGAYDFIVRPLRYGFEKNEEPRVLGTDVIGGRRTTGVVIREPFWTAKPVLGGCVNKLPVSGRSIGGAPYFEYADTFQIGEDVYAALDPGIVDPGNLSKMCALYVIQSKTDVEWNADNSLNHLAVLGGNAAAQRIKVQPGCINMNKVLIWPGAMQPGEYDIVADFGNNTSDAATFTPDHAYDTPLDVIDGYFLAGFRVVEDPGTLAEFTHAGSFTYLEADVTALGLQGTVTVQDENTHYATPGGFSSVNVMVPLRARVFFPADMAGATSPGQISGVSPDYPLAVIVHGNGHAYTSYDFLLEHFAKNGFIAASVHLNTGMSALGRANVFFKHLEVLQTLFGTKAQNNIGVMGHSRGGEAVLKIARLNQQQALGHEINALISLAPTDQYGSEVLGGAWATPYFVLYGARDGDINGGIWTPGYTVPQTGFALYDRANGQKKSMAFVYRATHNGFITTNYDAEFGDVPDLLTPADQQKITKAYMNAFFRRHLRNETKWDGLFTGEWKPASLAGTGVKLYMQYQDPAAPKIVDNFEGAASDWQTSTLGGAVSHGATLPVDPGEGRLHHHVSAAGLDPKSPHDSKGMSLRWDNLGDRLEISIPPTHKDVSGFSVLSLRLAQKTDSPHNPVNQAQDLRVALKDSGGNQRAIRVGAFGEIPYPDVRATNALTKSALTTVRIPLASYTIVCAGQPKVDLENVVSLSLELSMKAAGEIDIDDIEFTN